MIVGSVPRRSIVGSRIRRQTRRLRRRRVHPCDTEAAETKPASEQTTNMSPAAAAETLAPATATVRPTAKRRARQIPSQHRPASTKTSSPPRPTLGKRFESARGCSRHIGTRSASLKAFGSPRSNGSKKANSRSNGFRPQNIRRSRAAPKTSPCPIPSSAYRASDAWLWFSILIDASGRPSRGIALSPG